MSIDNDQDFVFRPLSNLTTLDKSASFIEQDPLGPLAPLRGKWVGTGFNTIWRPFFSPAFPDQHHFLELNLTEESIAFEEIPGDIPNRGFLQGDLVMNGLHYLQKVSDNFGSGLHIEPGVWLNVPQTSAPNEPPTVVRMGSIPHGTTIVAQGLPSFEARAPNIATIDIKPFPIGRPEAPIDFSETNLSIPTQFRSEPSLIAGITQAMVDDPNSVLVSALAGQTVVNTTNLIITTGSTPVLGGGTANTAFLQGDSAGPNANAAMVTAIFWIEQVEHDDGSQFLQLQYSQTVILDFAGLSWPHVSVATLRLVSAA